MASDRLVKAILGGVLGTRGKRTRNAARYLTGGRGGGFSNPTLVLGAAGLAWGVMETLQRTGTSSAGAPPPAALPPLSRPSPPDERGLDADALRLIRLAISAGSADGRLSEPERAVILQQAVAGGLGELVERELQDPQPLADIVAGVVRREDAATLYVMAFTIVRADEHVAGAERIYLARLAQLLALDPDTVAALEKDTGERIDALGDQGQSGG